MTLRELLSERLGASIHCLVTGTQVRTLALIGDRVDLRAGDDDQVAIDADAQIVYEPWCMDRGSILIKSCDRGVIKLCTEGDRIVLDDGTEVFVCWDDGSKSLWRAS